jgi:glycosyltransferase involved in cell wall biosynthesis
MRVAMIGTRGLPATHGGVERAVEGLAQGLTILGHDVTVFGRRGYCGDTTNMDGQAVRQVELPCVNTKHLEAASHTAIATAYVSLRRSFDIVHYHATGPAAFAGLLRFQGIPTVATVHGLDYKRDKWGTGAARALQVAARLAVTVPDRAIAVSKSLQETLNRDYDTDVTHIRNGVDLTDLDVAPEPVPEVADRPFVLFLGRFVPEKQPHLLIEAFRSLDNDARLVLAGPFHHAGDYEEKVRKAAAGDDRVVLIGPRYGPQKAWLLRNAKVFVLPSNLEGFPITPLEALASGTEVLVSDIPENIEAITIGGRRYGSVFRTGDVSSLRQALDRLLHSDDSPLAHAGAIRNVSSWVSIARETEVTYAQAIARHRRPHPIGELSRERFAPSTDPES